jgi:hypothetical protein
MNARERWAGRFGAVALTVLLLSGCKITVRDDDPDPPGPDAGSAPDAAVADAGTRGDASAGDAGEPPDGATPDAGPPADGGASDGGPADGGPADAGANEPPILEALTPSAHPARVDVDGTLAVSVTASDPEGQPLSYEWLASAGSFADSTAGATSFQAPSTAGLVDVTVTVTDPRGASASATFALAVAEAAGTFADVGRDIAGAQVENVKVAMDSRGQLYVLYVEPDASNDWGWGVVRHDGTVLRAPVHGELRRSRRGRDVDIAVSANDEIFVAFIDSSAADQIQVQRYDGASWEPVGDTSAFRGNGELRITCVGDVPHVVANFWEADVYRFGMLRYHAGAWSVVGDAIDGSTVSHIDTALVGTTPVVSYRSPGNSGDEPVYVSELDGTSWRKLGGGMVAMADWTDTALEVGSDGTLYLAHGTATGSDTTVWTWDGSAWSTFGPGIVYDASFANGMNLAVTSTDALYALDSERVFAFDGTAWQPLSSGPFGDVHFSGEEPVEMLVRETADGDLVFVVYADGSAPNEGVTIRMIRGDLP